MTAERDIERILETWFSDGPSRMPEGFVKRMVGRIESRPQSRLARLRTRIVTTNFSARLAVAVAMVVVVAVVGGTILSRLPAVGPSPTPSVVPSASTGPSPSVQAGVEMTRLQATWRSVGTRLFPYQKSTYAAATDLLIGPGTVEYASASADVLSSVALVGSDRLELTSETGPSSMGFKCNLGDLGTYAFSLSATGGRLTLTSVSDACPDRAAVLTGDWDHTNLGRLAPGRHVGTPFRPFSSGTLGTFSYTVPAGWTEQGESQSFFAVSGPDPAVLTWISILSNVAPSTEDKNCTGAPVADVGRTPTAVAAWLAKTTGLVVTKPTPVTIGGLNGLMVDVSVAKSWSMPCATIPQQGTDVSTFVDAYSGDPSQTIGGGTRERYFLLDRGDRQTLLIDIEAQDAASWDAVMTAAMPVVDTFEFVH
jgi:hypothetical protein